MSGSSTPVSTSSALSEVASQSTGASSAPPSAAGTGGLPLLFSRASALSQALLDEDISEIETMVFPDDGAPLADLDPLFEEMPPANDLEFDPIQHDVLLHSRKIFDWEQHSSFTGKASGSNDLDDLLNMVDAASKEYSCNPPPFPQDAIFQNDYNETENDGSSQSRFCTPATPGAYAHALNGQQCRDILTEAVTSSLGSTPGLFPFGVNHHTSQTQPQHFFVTNSSGKPVGELKLLNNQTTTSASSTASRSESTSISAAGDLAAGWPQQQVQPQEDGDLIADGSGQIRDASVSSTRPDYPTPSEPGIAGPIVLAPAASHVNYSSSNDQVFQTDMNDRDPYFPLPHLEVALMTSEARFMHLAQCMRREYPHRMHRFMLTCSGQSGLNHMAGNGDFMTMKSLLELKMALENMRLQDVLKLERLITSEDQRLERYEVILKEMMRISSQGDFSQWESKLLWAKLERKRLQEFKGRETSDDNQPSQLDEAGKDGDDDSVVSMDSDIEPDRLLLPLDYPFPEGPDLLRSNRDVAHPHEDSAVSDSVCQTHFGKVKFSVYPGIRWGRDPLRKKKRLEKKLFEWGHNCSNVFICDDLLEELDVDLPAEALMETLRRHNWRCPKAAEVLKREPGGRADHYGRSPPTSHLVIRRLADGTPFLTEDSVTGLQAPPKCMERNEFFSRLADGTMTLSGAAREGYATPKSRIRGDEDGGLANGAAGRIRCRRLSPKDVNNNKSYVDGALSKPQLLFSGTGPTPQEIAHASRVAKDLLARQSRELRRGGFLDPQMSALRDNDLGRSLLKRNHALLSLSERRSTGDSVRSSVGVAATSTATDSAVTDEPTWKSPLLSALVQSTQNSGRRGVSSPARLMKRSQSHQKSASMPGVPAAKRVASVVTAPKRPLPPATVTRPLTGTTLPTILLHQLPAPTGGGQGSALQRKASPEKQPLILPKPVVSVAASQTRDLTRSLTLERLAAQPSTQASTAGKSHNLGQVASVVVEGNETAIAGGTSTTMPLKPEPGSPREAGQTPMTFLVSVGDVEHPPAEMQSSTGLVTASQTTSAEEASVRVTIEEPPSPGSVLARDKILRAMVSLPDETDETSMHYHRPCHFSLLSLTIGGFRTEPGNAGKGRLKIIYSSRKIVYEFELSSSGGSYILYSPQDGPAQSPAEKGPDNCYGIREGSHRTPRNMESSSHPPIELERRGGSSRRNNVEGAGADAGPLASQTVIIEVKFSSVIALQSTDDELSIVVCQVPLVLISRQTLQTATHSTPVAPGHPLLMELVRNHLRNSPMHQLKLSASACEAAGRTLGRFSRRFRSMLSSRLHLDGYVPRWPLIASASLMAADAARSVPPTSREEKVTWLRPNIKHTCTCEYSCRSLDCPCSRGSLPCDYGGGRCGCGADCGNTFNTLRDEGVDVERAREDTCLVQNVFAVTKPADVRRLLSSRQPCPHCHLPVQVREAVPMQRPCPHCSRPVVFSWCQRKLRHSRNHCLVCIGCSDVHFQHCLVCKFCTRRTRPRGPCTQCVARVEGGSSATPSQLFVTPEARRFSQQLMSELKLASATQQKPEGMSNSGAETGGDVKVNADEEKVAGKVEIR